MMTNYGTELEKLKIQKKLFAQYTMFFRQSIHTARLGGRWKGRLCTTKPNQQTSKKLGSETTTGRIMSYNFTTESVDWPSYTLIAWEFRFYTVTQRCPGKTHNLTRRCPDKRSAWLSAESTKNANILANSLGHHLKWISEQFRPKCLVTRNI